MLIEGPEVNLGKHLLMGVNTMSRSPTAALLRNLNTTEYFTWYKKPSLEKLVVV